jgi:cellulose synthase/poly-beta-1,6-N-acetylglucosamine synthase-like glycosyltransferase
MLGQIYPDLEIILTVDQRGDPLFAALEALCREVAPGRAKVLAADDSPPINTASGKCAAHLRALEEVRASSEVFVFADDDTRPRPDWVARLVATLADERVAASTGYRWYIVEGGGIASHVRSAWNLVGLQIMFDPRFNFAWGGGMALRRKEFEAWKLADGWRRAISDDYVVTVTAKKDKRPIIFVPGALAPSFEQMTVRTMLQWARRQTFMTKIYDPALWKYAILPYLFFNSTVLVGALLLVALLLGLQMPLWALFVAVAFALHFPLNLIKAAIYYRGVRRMLPEYDARLRRLRIAYLAGSVMAPFVTIYSLLATRNLRIIEWRGKRYEVDGPLNVRPLP